MDNKNKEWIVMHCLDAFRDANGGAGENKIPLEGFATPMTKQAALKALAKVEQSRPQEDFSIRRIAPVLPIR